MLRFTLLFILIAYSLSVQSLNVFRVAADEWPPFTSEKSDQRIAVDLVQTALIRTGWMPKITITDWGKIAPAIKAGELDGIIAEWYTKEREEYLLFSQPYLENRIIALGLKNKASKVSAIAQLKGKRVALVKGYAYGDKLLANASFNAIYSESVQKNLQLLLTEKVDYLLADELVLKSLYTQLSKSERKQLQSHSTPLTIKKLFFVVSKQHPKADIIIDKFNRAIQEMVNDGSYNDILGFGVIFRTDEEGIADVITSKSKLDLSLPDQAQDGYQVFSEDNAFAGNGSMKYRVGGQTYANWDDAKKAINEGSQEVNKLDPDQDQENEYQLLIPIR